MSESISELHGALTPDPWRAQVPFSADVLDVHRVLHAETAEKEKADALNSWIGQSQPCLFGRAAARLQLLSFCILDQRDLARGDQHLMERIQDARLGWLRAAAQGEKHGFIILLSTPELAGAVPSPTVQRLAQRLCSLYLLREVECDHVEHEHIYLDVPDYRPRRFRWLAGVNYFSAHGDGRWWQDHRMPGGIALSVNSVGHMVFASRARGAFKDLRTTLGLKEVDEGQPVRLETLGDALLMAMRTIGKAQGSVSGVATRLLAAGDGEPSPGFSLPRDVAGRSVVKYAGYYHTDFTLPAEYFRPEVARDPRAIERELDFSYLWNSRLENLDHFTMGVGVRTAAADGREWRQDARRGRIVPELIDAVAIPFADAIFGT